MDSNDSNSSGLEKEEVQSDTEEDGGSVSSDSDSVRLEDFDSDDEIIDYDTTFENLLEASQIEDEPVDQVHVALRLIKECFRLCHQIEESTCLEAVVEGDTKNEKLMEFMKKWLPKIILNFLDRRIIDDFLLDGVRTLIRKSLRLVIKGIGLDIRELVAMLTDIFSVNARFYERTTQPSNFLRKDGLFAMPPQETSASWLLVDNLNFFGKFGGFEAIVNRIQQKIGREEGEEGTITVAQATRLVLWVIPVARHLRVTFLERWGVKLKNVLFSLVLQLSEAELRETKKASILLVVDCVSTVLKRIMTKEQCGELLEKFQLAISLKCLESPFLEKRLNGLVGLNLLITMATRRSEEKIMAPITSSSPPMLRSKGRETTKWLEVDYLVRWIEHKHILEVILQKSVHEELIKRSLKLFKFLAQTQRLTTLHITLIWEATLGKPKTIVYQLYNLLCDLICFLPHPLIEFLCDNKLRQIPLEQLDNETLLLIRQATVGALNECEEEGNKWYGLETLWSAIQGASDDVASEAIRHLGDILGRTNCLSFRFQLMERCVSNLRGHKSVLRSLEVLRKILETFPRSQFSDGVAMPIIIEQLESNYQFLDLFFEDLSFFKEITTLPSNLPSSSSTSFTWKTVSDLKARLTFLQFLLSEATLDLEQKHIDVLWNSFFLVTSSSEEKDTVFGWLSTICFEGRLSPELIEYIFLDKIASLEFVSLSEDGFSCFERYFCFTNKHKGKLQEEFMMSKVSSMDSDQLMDFSVIDENFDLVGLDSLWKIVFFSTDFVVVKQSIDFLNSLYDSLSPELQSQEGRLREEYVNTIMENLRKVQDGNIPSSQSFVFSVQRCLYILEMFINEYEEKVRKQKCFGGNDNFFDWKEERWGAQFSLTVQAVTATGESFELQVRAGDQLGKLRAEIASRLDKTPHCVRLIIGDDMPEEGEMFYPLEHYRINADSVVQYFVCDESPPEKVEKQLTSPLEVLSKNQHYFEQLFELLDNIAKQTQDASVTEVSQQAWSLIVKIPINPRLQGLLHNLDFAGEEVPWSSLIDPQSLYRLSYALQIIELIFISGKRLPTEPDGLASSQENPGVVEWTRKFSEKGGFRHLFNILMTFKPESSSSASCSNSTPIFKSCLESLLTITNCFMLASCPHTYQEEESHLVLRPDGEFDWVDFSALLVRLLNILEQVTEEGPGLKSSTSSTSSLVGSMSQLTLGNQGEIEGRLVRDTCDLLVACLTSKPDLLTVVYSYPDLCDFFKRVLVFSTNEHLRLQISKSLRIIILATSTSTSDRSPSVVPPLDVFLPLLLELLSDLPPRLQSCTQYFGLVVSLLHCCDRERPIHKSWLSNLFPLLFNLLQSHPVIEISDIDAPDRVLGGLLHILGNLIVIEPSLVKEEGRCLSLVEEVYNRCLFDGYPSMEHLTPTPPKCKTQYARVEAFALLKTLRVVAHEEVQTHLLPFIHQQHSVINRDVFSTSWNFSPLMDQRSEVGYVGVKNLGCTCYMNSLLQQFFMMPTFRRGILSLSFNSPPSTTTMKEEQRGRLNGEDQDELLFQLQVMFCHLQESTRRYYDPTVFCMVNKDYEGRPTNVRVQMDVDEFFNMLSEKLDNSLQNTSQPSLLKNTWGGTIASQLICKGCPHYSEREEPFYTISLDIKNKSSIKEALELYVQGEMLEGDNAYFCDACKKLVDALKRSCIKTLPDTLILHLKRFEFNFDNFRKMKVNDRCDFSQVLDMDPYTKQSLARRDNPNSEESMDLDSRGNLYQLAGVLVHRGVADSGHYYSFIKERPAKDQNGRWIEFNDETVRPFDPNLIIEECFGGMEEFWQEETRRNQVVEKSRSAYMIIYERINKLDSGSEGVHVTPSNSEMSLDKYNNSLESTYQKIKEENALLEHHKRIFEPDYFNFIKETLLFPSLEWTDSEEVVLEKAKLAFFFYLEVIARSKERHITLQFATTFVRMLQHNQTASRWVVAYLSEQRATLANHLVHCPFDKVRTKFAEILETVINVSLPFEAAEIEEHVLLLEERNKHELPSPEKHSPFPHSIGVLGLVDILIELIPELPRSRWKGAHQLFNLLDQFANHTVLETTENQSATSFGVRYLLASGVISRIALLAPTEEEEEKKDGKEKETPRMESMVSLLSVLVTSVDFLELTEQDRSALMSTQLLYWCITCNGRPSEIGRMVAHCCRDNEDASTFFVNSLVSIIDNATSTAMKQWFKIYGMVLAVEDELQDERISDGMRDLLRSLNRQRKQYPKSVRAALTQIVQLCSKNAALNNFVEGWRDRADWLDRLFHNMLNTPVNSNITPTSSTSSLTWSKQAATSFSSSFNSPYS